MPELAEYGAELPQVFPQERIRLPLRHGACQTPFPRQHLMSSAHVRIIQSFHHTFLFNHLNINSNQEKNSFDNYLGVSNVFQV